MEHGKTFKQLEKDNKQETLLKIQQNLKVVTTQRLEEKIHELQKQLSDFKLSNKTMKTQLTRVNVLKVSKKMRLSKILLSFGLFLFLLHVSPWTWKINIKIILHTYKRIYIYNIKAYRIIKLDATNLPLMLRIRVLSIPLKPPGILLKGNRYSKC